MAHISNTFIACGIAITLVICDFITGITASNHLSIPIKSNKLRRSISKCIIYCLFLLSTLSIGIALQHLLHHEHSLPFAIVCLKYQTFLIIWIELISNLENLIKIFPHSKFLEIIHNILSTQISKYLKKS